MFAVQRTWEIFTNESTAEGFIGYEYALDESEALAKTIVKYGAPEKWGITHYTIKKIKWTEEDI
jgi:hypothetical protein|tara:strand:- start:113 stop:304 length:192 start_codon:yes stop_codon:yes gene_type:complete